MVLAREGLLEKARSHKVTHLFTRSKAFFQVDDSDGKSHQVAIQVFADTAFQGIVGAARGELDSYALAAILKIAETGSLQVNAFETDTLLEMRRNESLALLRATHPRINEVVVSSAEGAAHAGLKAAVCLELRKQGKMFVTEATFSTDGRADIFVLDDCLAIEIADSETDESLERKRKEYPLCVGFQIVRVYEVEEGKV